MTKLFEARRALHAVATALIAGLTLLLTGCFVSPGKFTSELALGPDQEFAFTYEGEIFFVALSSLASRGLGGEEFAAEDCYEDGTQEVRECTANELAGQRAAWEAAEQERSAQAKVQAQQMAALLGGVDPTDPEAAEKFAQVLRRQKGWSRVEHKGDGLFEVSYRAQGRLTHDFMFPMIEGVPTTNPFVQIVLREGGIARITAPGFSSQDQTNPMASMMGGMGSLAGMAAMAPDATEGTDKMPQLPMMDGLFTVTTSRGMAIRANNTDEGPATTANGELLRWEINPSTKAAPLALIQYGT